MAASEPATRPTGADPGAFIAAVPDPRRREEAGLLDALHRRVTGQPPRMWGPSIVGYGRYRYRTASGYEGEMCRAGFSPRRAAATVYLMSDAGERRGEAEALLARLGPHRTGRACLYITRLARVDLAVLEELVALHWEIMAARYPD